MMICSKSGLAALTLTLTHLTARAADPPATDVACDFASRYGVVVEQEVASPGELRLVVAVSDFALMGRCLSEGCDRISGEIHAAGSVVSFGCGSLEVAVTALPADQFGEALPASSAAEEMSFELWAAGGDAQEQSDGDGDGVPALVEYALGLDPAVADGHLASRAVPVTLAGERFVGIQYRRDLGRGDVVIEVQRSPDLSAGSWTRVGVVDQLVATSGQVQTRVGAVRLDGGRQFLRLLVRRGAQD